jgi:PAS domain S-box-containing protein
MAEQIQDVFWLTSADYQQLLYVSPSFETIWGHPLKSLYDYPGGHLNLIVDSIHPSDRERIVAALAQQLHNEYKADYRIVRPDDSMRWMRSRFFPIQNRFGETWAIAGICEDITERKRTEELLHRREQEFRHLVEHSPDIVSRFDRELRHVYVNPAIELATGIPSEEFVGKTNRELGMPQELTSLWEPSIQKVFQTSQPDELEFNYPTPQGWRYYHSRLFPEVAANGSVESVLAICRDITKAKQTEEALRESEERFRTAFEFAPIGIALTNRQGNLFASNRAFQQIIGYTAQELQNQSLIQFTAPSDRADDCTLLEELLAGKRTHVSREQRFERKDGCLVWGNVSVSAVCDAKGAFQHAIVMIQDITAQKQVQLELQNAHDELEKRVAERTAELVQANTLLQQEIAERKQAQEELKAQKGFLQTVIDTNPNIIFVKDIEGKYVLVNQAFADFYGITIEEMIGLTDSEFNPNQADIERYIAQDREVFTTLQQQFIPEEACHSSIGLMRWFQTTKKPLFSSNGQVCLVLGVCTDITERKHAQEALRLSEARFRVAIDNLPNIFVIYDAQRRIQFVNALGLKHSRKSLEEHLGKIDEEIWSHEVTKHYLPILKRTVETQTIQTGECTIALPHTDTLTFIVSYVPLLNEQGEIEQILAITHDITERQQAETHIKQSLQEKEVLLQEIHHRVKNNLQVISSLLDLQSQHIDNPAMLEVFRESCNRVRSMALIHEQLYQSQNCARINFSDYIKQLTNYLFQSYSMHAGDIILELDIEEVTLNINTAIPCGLIISELVSNCLKYAFPQGNSGIIQIALRSDADNHLTLIVKDNGIGFPANWGLKSVKSLGLR